MRPELLVDPLRDSALDEAVDPEVLINRCHLHYKKHYQCTCGESAEYVRCTCSVAPPSASRPKPLPKEAKEPKGWRCQTWAEVVERCGPLNVLSNKGQPPAPPTTPSGSGSTADALQPGTYPRTLELWCGRAGKSAH